MKQLRRIHQRVSVRHCRARVFVPLRRLSPADVSSADRYISNHSAARRRPIAEVCRPASRIELIARFNIVRRGTSPRRAPKAERFVCLFMCVRVCMCAVHSPFTDAESSMETRGFQRSVDCPSRKAGVAYLRAGTIGIRRAFTSQNLADFVRSTGTIQSIQQLPCGFVKKISVRQITRVSAVAEEPRDVAVTLLSTKVDAHCDKLATWTGVTF